ncbi:hypothetical protein [Cellulomonas uda]|uniref:Uncharacterized protein n=1 Tax=Cellulomonas uda TaxID=1714 RepID=A0A4Y3KC41_CELUD|nr:hypothetical protein [Cellulomonas uda]NII67516.1 hypothetical protein [Cellulomonas uda]GEA81266.1 hypothetical protein CUD01_17100 [Cellulomonas uda]
MGTQQLVPSHPPTSVRHVLRELSDVVGRGEPRLRRVPAAVLRAGGRVVPLLREVDGIRYQFDEPFVVDTAETTATFGLEPVPWRSLVETTARAWAAHRD